MVDRQQHQMAYSDMETQAIDFVEVMPALMADIAAYLEFHDIAREGAPLDDGKPDWFERGWRALFRARGADQITAAEGSRRMEILLRELRGAK